MGIRWRVLWGIVPLDVKFVAMGGSGDRGGGPVPARAWWDGGRIWRGSAEWKEMGQLENHCYFGLRRASAHAGLQMLMSLAAQPDQFLAEAVEGRSAGSSAGLSGVLFVRCLP